PVASPLPPASAGLAPGSPRSCRGLRQIEGGEVVGGPGAGEVDPQTLRPVLPGERVDAGVKGLSVGVGDEVGGVQSQVPTPCTPSVPRGQQGAVGGEAGQLDVACLGSHLRGSQYFVALFAL